MIDVFVSIQELLAVAGVKCEEIVVDMDSFMRIQASLVPYMRMTQEPVQPIEEIRIAGLKITYPKGEE